jgi:hypothetical protein
VRLRRDKLGTVHDAALVMACHRFHWLGSPATDRCAHGGVTIRFGDDVLVDHADRDWNLTAAGLMLLRTLDADHTAASRVGDQLVPCCGHAWFASGPADVMVIGCVYGLDWEVRHAAGHVALRFDGRPDVGLSWTAWRDAV